MSNTGIGKIGFKSPRIRYIPDLLLGLAGMIVLISAAVVLVLNLRILYYTDIRLLDLPHITGLSESMIRRNYDCLIDYNLIWKQVPELIFPDFPMSESGKIHFYEVRNIFFLIQGITFFGGVIWIFLLVCRLRKGKCRALRYTAVFLWVIPTALGILIAVNWESFFIGFHKVFFRNDYWLFDPVSDPVINILPDMYFMHCAAAIILLVLAAGILCEAGYRRLRKAAVPAI